MNYVFIYMCICICIYIDILFPTTIISKQNFSPNNFFTADAICNCPIPSGLNPYDGSTITTTKNLNIQDSDFKINQTYPFSVISNGSSMDTGENLYSTIVSYKNCDIT